MELAFDASITVLKLMLLSFCSADEHPECRSLPSAVAARAAVQDGVEDFSRELHERHTHAISLVPRCPPAKHLQLQKCLVMGDDDEEASCMIMIIRQKSGEA